MIGAALMNSVWTIPPAIIVGLLMVWYFASLGREHVPASRRRIRRLSLVAAILLLPMLVRVLSFIDPEQQPREYIVMWSVVFVMLLIVMAFALMDMVNNLRLHHEAAKAELHEAAAELAQAIRQRHEAFGAEEGYRDENHREEQQ